MHFLLIGSDCHGSVIRTQVITENNSSNFTALFQDILVSWYSNVDFTYLMLYPLPHLPLTKFNICLLYTSDAADE